MDGNVRYGLLLTVQGDFGKIIDVGSNKLCLSGVNGKCQFFLEDIKMVFI